MDLRKDLSYKQVRGLKSIRQVDSLLLGFSREDVEEITKKIGTLDALELMATLESFGVNKDVQISDFIINIPRTINGSLADLKIKLNGLSKAGRLFPISEKGNGIEINILIMKAASDLGANSSTPAFKLKK